MRLLSPGFLLLLPLALLPLLIHLLSRFRLRRLPFPSLLLLKTVEKERFTGLRLREITLLILRTLALTSLLFALARPRLTARIPGLSSGPVIVVLDDSYSMGYGNRWPAAKAALGELVNSRARVYLILASRPDTTFIEKAGPAASLDTIKPSALAARLGPALERAQQLSRTSALPILVLTDLQRSALPETTLRPPSAGLHLINLGTPEFVNVTLRRITLDRPYLRAEITNPSRVPQTRTVRLRLPDRPPEELSVNLGPHARTEVTFTTRFDRPGTYTGQVELSPDSLPLDDIRYFAFNIPEKIPVLIVSSAAVPARYLTLALAADTTAPFAPQVIDVAELRRMELRRFPVVVVTDAAALTPADWDRLDLHLNSGGAALVIAGTPLAPGTGLDRYLKPRGFYRGPGFLSIAEVDTNHPLLSVFRPSDFAPAQFYSATRLAGGRPLLLLRNGDPLITELPNHHLLVWSFAPLPEKTNLVYRAPFAPLVLRTLTYLSSLPLRTECRVGDTLVLPVARRAIVKLSTPSAEITLTPRPALPRPEVVVTETRTPGIYTLDTTVFAVNPDPAEGDLTPLDPASLRTPGVTVENRASPGADLTPPLLYLALFAFLMEMVLLVFENRIQNRIPVRR